MVQFINRKHFDVEGDHKKHVTEITKKKKSLSQNESVYRSGM